VAQAEGPEFKPQYCKKRKKKRSRVLVAHASNPSYSEIEITSGSQPWVNSLWDPISKKKSITKRSGRVAQELSSNPNTKKKKKKGKKDMVCAKLAAAVGLGPRPASLPCLSPQLFPGVCLTLHQALS
jgi:hypothetical protein